MCGLYKQSICIRLAVFGFHGHAAINLTLVLHRFIGERAKVCLTYLPFNDLLLQFIKNSLPCFSFTKGEIVLHCSAFLEIFISAIVTLLMYEPYWSLKIHSCAVLKLSDWYTLFHNPTPNYDKKLYCTQEAVYPL